MGELKICKRCVLPESKPDIRLNPEGLCNICVEFDKIKKTYPAGNDFVETDFIKLLEKHKAKGEYDCLAMCSGGKDSISALYYAKVRYKLNPLIFTFDNGFEDEIALKNVKNASEILGVDFLFFKSDFMQEMFAEVIRSGSAAVICHLCSIWYMQLAFDVAQKYRIPIIIAGWTKGQSVKKLSADVFGNSFSSAGYDSMAKETREFLTRYTRAVPKYKNFPQSIDEVVRRANRKFKTIVLSPHWFLHKDAEEYIEVIKKELGWLPVEKSYPIGSTNCFLNFITVHNSMKYYGYTHYHLEMSRLIRQGLLSREQALKALTVDFDKNFLNTIAGKLGCQLD